MQVFKPKILIISSANPKVGPGVLASDFLTAFTREGYVTDMLTLNRVKDNPEYLYVQDPESISYRIRNKIYTIYNRVVNKFSKLSGVKENKSTGSYCFFYREEENPPVPVDKVLSKVKSDYDIVIVLFWQQMLSFKTIKAIYRKLKCPIRFNCVDYSTMSGGCHFTGDCQRYMTGCGCCPAFQSDDPNDFTHRNVEYREKVYEEINPIVSGNSYMQSFFDRSKLLKTAYKVKSFPIIDTDSFYPIEKSVVRDEYNIPSSKKFLILFGSQNVADERKGVKYLVDALNIFSKMLSEEEVESVLLVVIGRDFSKIRNNIDERLESIELGFVSIDTLPKVYSLADVFLCSSVNDAGPMMVNQSLCCGTPVVGFEMGACLDAVKGRGTGYCAKLRDGEDFAKGIMSVFKLNQSEREKQSEICRKLAVETYSFKSTVDRVMGDYRKYMAGNVNNHE